MDRLLPPKTISGVDQGTSMELARALRFLRDFLEVFRFLWGICEALAERSAFRFWKCRK